MKQIWLGDFTKVYLKDNKKIRIGLNTVEEIQNGHVLSKYEIQTFGKKLSFPIFLQLIFSSSKID